MNAAILEKPHLGLATAVSLEACHDMLEAQEIWRAIEAEWPAWDFNATWISFRTWARHFAQGETPVFKIIADVRVAGLLPAVTTTRSKGGVSFRVLHTAGNEHWWTGYPIIGAEGEEAIRALILALIKQRDWDVLEIGPMVNECPLVRLLVAVGEESNLMPVTCHQEDDWRLLIRGKWEEYYKARGANLRQTVARGERRLAARGEVTFDIWAGFPEHFEEFCQIEGSGWKGRAGTAIRCESAARNFHEDLMRSAAERGQLRLFFLRLNGHAAASIETLLHEGVAYLIKLGRDETFDSCWPGHVAFKRMLEYSFRAGDARTLDMGIGGGAHGGYKQRWATEKRAYITLRFFRLLQKIRFTGIAEAEYKWDEITRRFLLIEINPRVWDQHRLGASIGLDLPYLAYCELAGLPVPRVRRQAAERKWIAEDRCSTTLFKLLWKKSQVPARCSV